MQRQERATRRPCPAQQYFVPPSPSNMQVPLPAAAATLPPPRLMAPQQTCAQVTACEQSKTHVITLSSANGGIGTSVYASLLARRVAQSQYSCALIDADMRDGGAGLDVLLGLEHNPGKRWQDIEAPLGFIEGKALQQELLQWESVYVLPYDSWQGTHPQLWEMNAVIVALGASCDVLVVDGAQGGVLQEIDSLKDALHIVLVELSVLGLARAKAHIAWLNSANCVPSMQPKTAKSTRHSEHGSNNIVVLGVRPCAARRNRGVVPLEEAAQFLHEDILGIIRPDSRLNSDLMDGLGIRSIPKKNRTLLDDVFRVIEQYCERGNDG